MTAASMACGVSMRTNSLRKPMKCVNMKRTLLPAYTPVTCTPCFAPCFAEPRHCVAQEHRFHGRVSGLVSGLGLSAGLEAGSQRWSRDRVSGPLRWGHPRRPLGGRATSQPAPPSAASPASQNGSRDRPRVLGRVPGHLQRLVHRQQELRRRRFVEAAAEAGQVALAALVLAGRSACQQACDRRCQ
jgi:hypothetical protein